MTISCGHHLCKALNSVYAILLRVLCALVLVIQSSLLNQFLIIYIGNVFFLWILFDIAVFAVFTTSFVLSYRFLTIRRHEDDTSATKVTDNAHRRNLFHHLAGRELPLAYIAWLLYSLGLSARIWLIYGPWYNVVGVVTVRMFFGTNALRLAVSLTAIVFFLLVSTHHDAPVASQRQLFLESLGGTVALDLLDASDMLDVLIVSFSHVFLTYQVQLAVIWLVCCTVILPTILLIALSHGSYGRSGVWLKRLRILHRIIFFALVNVAMLVLRCVVWQKHESRTSVFIVKNVFGVAVAVHEVTSQLMQAAAARHTTDMQQERAVQLELTTAKQQT